MHVRRIRMRRPFRRRPDRTARKRHGFLLSAALGIGLALLFIWTVDRQLQPMMEAAAQAKATNVVTVALDGAISEYINQHKMGYGDFVRMEKDESGQITALTSDMTALNGLRTGILTVAVETVDSLDRAQLSIPAGNLTGLHFLSGKGVSLPVDVVAVGFAHAEFENAFSDAGINQTRHQILLDVTVTIDILLPGEILRTEVMAQVPVAETVIVGAVPETFLQLSGS